MARRLRQRPCSQFPLCKRSREGGRRDRESSRLRSLGRHAATVPVFRARAPVRTPQGLPSPSRKRRREQRIRPARSDGLVQTRSCGRARGATRVELSRLVGPSTKAPRLEIPLCGVQTCRAQRGVGVRRGRDSARRRPGLKRAAPGTGLAIAAAWATAARPAATAALPAATAQSAAEAAVMAPARMSYGCRTPPSVGCQIQRRASPPPCASFSKAPSAPPLTPHPTWRRPAGRRLARR